MRFADVVMFIAFLTSLAFLWGIVDGTIQMSTVKDSLTVGTVGKECGK